MKTRDVIAVLTADHEKVRGLLEQLDESTARGVKKRETLLRTIGQELRIHTAVEEEIVYPAFKEIASDEEDETMLYEAKEEHHLVDLVLTELEALDPTTPEFSAKACVLKELVEHHADEEEDEMFPMMKKEIAREQLMSLGERVEQRKQELMRNFDSRRPRQRSRDNSASAPN